MKKLIAFLVAPRTVFMLTILIGFVLLYPSIDYHSFMSTGDHGRDFYAFERTLHGDLADRDYWWVYGPLMPFYYAAFMKLLGINMLSVLIGKTILIFLAGILVFLSISTIASAGVGLLASVWFWLCYPDFFFTHNHIGGTVCVIAITYFLLSYVKAPTMRWLWLALSAALVLSLIKVNFGLTGLAVTLFTSFLVDRTHKIPLTRVKRNFYLTGFIGIPLVIIAVYAFVLKGLTFYEIRQCLPYSDADQPSNTMPWIAIGLFWNNFIQNLTVNWMNPLICLLVVLSTVRTTTLLITKKLPPSLHRQTLLALAVLGTYCVLNFHEFLKSGVWYRCVWAQPLTTMIIFVLIATAAQSLGRAWRFAIYGLIIILAAVNWRTITTIHDYYKQPGQYLDHPRAKVFVANEPGWIQTVKETTAFLEKTLDPGEQFFALPYDALYYYLTGRKSPTRQLIFFDHTNIPPDQEKKIIRELEEKKIRYVLLSSRCVSKEIGLGILGKTYCPLIGRYLVEHFQPVAQFGDWQNPPGWGWNHGTLILKRKDALK